MYAKNAWDKYESNQYQDVMDFNEGYKAFLTAGKTERACVKESVELAKKAGFQDIENMDSLKPGDKFYVINKDKNLALFIMGEKPLVDGMRILGAHIDSPRLDLKQNPLYESDGFALLDTHYYGGVKKYQWVTIPLSLYGVVIKKDGTKIDVVIGEDDHDPVVGITDLLIHLSADQMQKTAAKVIEGENNKNEVTKSIDEELDKVENYTEQALFYARSNAVEKDYIINKTNLKEIVNGAILKNKTTLLNEKVSIELSNLKDEEVYTDSKWAVFIINQIIQNAIKYSKKENKKIEISSQEKNDKVILYIKDNGIGIKKEEIICQ